MSSLRAVHHGSTSASSRFRPNWTDASQAKATSPHRARKRTRWKFSVACSTAKTTLGTPNLPWSCGTRTNGPGSYKDMAVAFRPSHADATYQAKYGIQARSGGGRASARETIGRVAAGAIAKQLLKQAAGTEILAWVKRIHTIEASGIDPQQVQLSDVEANIVRCPEPAIAERMIERIEAIGREGDSCAG